MKSSPFGSRLLSAFMLRFYMSVILSSTAALGMLWSWALLRVGVTSMPLRYALATVGCYACFFVLMRLWLAWVTGAFQHIDVAGSFVESVHTKDVADLVEWGAEVAHSNADTGDALVYSVKSVASETDSVSIDIDLGGDSDSEGIVFIVLLLAFAAIAFGAGIYLIWIAPNILTDAALQFALAAGLIKPVKKLREQSWLASTFKATRIPFVIMLLVSILVGALCQGFFPGSIRMADVLSQL